jgi:hypothetical protein
MAGSTSGGPVTPANPSRISISQNPQDKDMNRRQRLRAYLETGARHRETSKKRKALDDIPGTDDDETEPEHPEAIDPALHEPQPTQDPEFTGEQLNDKCLVLDRVVRWHAFLYASNFFFNEIIKEVFGQLRATGRLRMEAKDKIFAGIKNYKSQTMSFMKVRIKLLDSRSITLT